MKRWIFIADAISSLGQRHKILNGFRRRLTKQPEDNATSFLSINFYVEEHLVSNSCLSSLLQQKCFMNDYTTKSLPQIEKNLAKYDTKYEHEQAVKHSNP